MGYWSNQTWFRMIDCSYDSMLLVKEGNQEEEDTPIYKKSKNLGWLIWDGDSPGLVLINDEALDFMEKIAYYSLSLQGEGYTPEQTQGGEGGI